MLVILLGIVISTMRYLQQPATVDQLGRAFQLEDSSHVGQEAESLELQPATPISTATPVPERDLVQAPTPTEESKESLVRSAGASLAEQAGVDLSPVKDNTYFRPEEQEAWFGILKHLRESPPPSMPATGVTYAQLLKQPEEYRGQLVAVSGSVVREEHQQAPENEQGIEAYHRLIVRPEGGGVWPFVVYAMELPERFPTGDRLRIPVEIEGVFFKNWSYAWEDGLGLAPVVLAHRIHWQAPVLAPEQNPVTGRQFAIGIVAALAAATVVVGFVWLRTRPQASSPYRRHSRSYEADFPETKSL